VVVINLLDELMGLPDLTDPRLETLVGRRTARLIISVTRPSLGTQLGQRIATASRA